MNDVSFRFPTPEVTMFRRAVLCLGVLWLAAGGLHAQDANPAARVARLAFENAPDSVTLGDSVHLKAVAYDASNKVVDFE